MMHNFVCSISSISVKTFLRYLMPNVEKVGTNFKIEHKKPTFIPIYAKINATIMTRQPVLEVSRAKIDKTLQINKNQT